MRVAIFLSAILALILIAAALPMSVPAEAGAKTNSLIIHSSRDLQGTVDALEASLRKRGVATIVKVDNHGYANASETLVLFPDPERAQRPAGARSLDDADLPMRALVYKDGDAVAIAFDDAKGLAKRNGLSADEAEVAGRTVASVVAEAAND